MRDKRGSCVTPSFRERRCGPLNFVRPFRADRLRVHRDSRRDGGDGAVASLVNTYGTLKMKPRVKRLEAEVMEARRSIPWLWPVLAILLVVGVVALLAAVMSPYGGGYYGMMGVGWGWGMAMTAMMLVPLVVLVLLALVYARALSPRGMPLADVLESRRPNRLHVLRLHGCAADAVRPELRVQAAYGAHVHLHHDVCELEAPARFQHTENLPEGRGLVRYEVQHSVARDHFDARIGERDPCCVPFQDLHILRAHPLDVRTRLRDHCRSDVEPVDLP